MALTDYKVTDADITSKGVVAAPDTMIGTASENKMIFDRLIREVIKADLAGVIDSLVAATAAGELGFNATEGISADNIQAAIEAVYNAAGTGAATAVLNALKAEGFAVGKQNGADVESGSTYYHNNAKYFCEHAEELTVGKADGASARGLGNAIGMRSWNQQLRNGNFVNTDGLTYHRCTVAASNNELTATITNASDIQSVRFGAGYTVGHVYLCSEEINVPRDITSLRYGVSALFYAYNLTAGWNQISSIRTLTEGNGGYYLFYSMFENGDAVKVKKANMFDLTEIFGAGNEPETVEEFRKMFPAGYYPYCNGNFSDLLWENASPTANFQGQSILLVMDDYKQLYIEYKVNKDSNVYCSEIIDIGNTLSATSIYGGKMISRNVSFLENGLSFTTGYVYETYGSGVTTNDASMMIPYKIYGVR